MKKMKKAPAKLEASKPRNPLHRILGAKRGGAHEKSEKATRAQMKMQLRKGKMTEGDFGHFHFRDSASIAKNPKIFALP